MILLQTSKLTKLYSGTPILENVQFEVKKGERIAVVGRNGAGKSTLMNVLGGIYKPDTGSIKIDGQDVTIGSVVEAQKLGAQLPRDGL